MLGVGLGLAVWMGCSEGSDAGGGACGTDDDCKGDRICEDGSCVDPGASSGEGGSSGSGALVGGSGGAPPSSECLTEVKCANQLDCPVGHHCNTALEVPHCQELYCGGVGTACSSTELCDTGLLCVGGACMTAPECDNCCDGGQTCSSHLGTIFNPNPDAAGCLDWDSLPQWAALRDCLCNACASQCQSWCATGQHGQDPYICMQCMEVGGGFSSGNPDAVCGEQAAACSSG
jgi:hypothetical protein